MTRKKALTVACLVASASFVQRASAGFLGGGFVSLQSWNDAANATIGAFLGQPVTVYRLYALFDGTSPSIDHVGGVGNFELWSSHEIVNLTEGFPDSTDPLQHPIVAWDSYFTINIDDRRDGLAPNQDSSNAWGSDTVQGIWWVSTATNQGIAGTNAGSGVSVPSGTFAVMLAQFTVLRAPVPVGDYSTFNTDGTIGANGTGFIGHFSLVVRDTSSPVINHLVFIDFSVPAPGVVATVLLGGGVWSRRRRG